MLSIIYDKGNLERIDNITEHAISLFKFPRNINISHYQNFEVRGEAFFESLNKMRVENEKPLWANPRNITAGTLKTLDIDFIDLVKERQLDFYAYSFYSQTNSPSTQEEALKLISTLDFSTAPTYKVCHNVSEIMDYIHYWQKHKDIIPVGIDGIVIKVNDLQQQQITSLGDCL
jgi:DNA ligase (NAD+)